MKLALTRNQTIAGVAAIAALALVITAATTGAFDSTREVTLPAGTTISVRLDHALSTDQNESGDDFEATVYSPVVADGVTVIPAGAAARGQIVEARESGRLKGVARLRVTLDEVEVDDSWVDINTTASSRQAGNHKKRNAILIGGGAGTGALIGAIAGGGTGAAIGAGIGAGAGTAAAAYTGKKDIRLPAETLLTFRLTEPVTVNVKKNPDKDKDEDES